MRSQLLILRRSLQKVLRKCLAVDFTGKKGFSEGFSEEVLSRGCPDCA